MYIEYDIIFGSIKKNDGKYYIWKVEIEWVIVKN